MRVKEKGRERREDVLAKYFKEKGIKGERMNLPDIVKIMMKQMQKEKVYQ